MPHATPSFPTEGADAAATGLVQVSVVLEPGFAYQPQKFATVANF
jgi:hypothetical protein